MRGLNPDIIRAIMRRLGTIGHFRSSKLAPPAALRVEVKEKTGSDPLDFPVVRWATNDYTLLV
jgi:hypothetical protein